MENDKPDTGEAGRFIVCLQGGSEQVSSIGTVSRTISHLLSVRRSGSSEEDTAGPPGQGRGGGLKVTSWGFRPDLSAPTDDS